MKGKAKRDNIRCVIVNVERGRVAQQVEQLAFNQWVVGSNPAALTKIPFTYFPEDRRPVVS